MLTTSTTSTYLTDHTEYPSSTGDINTEDFVTITTTGTSPLWYTTNTTTSYTLSSPPITIQDALNRIEKRRYHCIYCGTEYIEEKEGFIPNCKNCGAILRKCQE